MSLSGLDELPASEELQELPAGWARQYSIKLIGNKRVVKCMGYLNEHTQDVVQTLDEVLELEKMKQAEEGDSQAITGTEKDGECKVWVHLIGIFPKQRVWQVSNT